MTVEPARVPPEVSAFLDREPAHLIDGSWTPARNSGTLDVIDPSNGRTISQIARGDASDIDAAVSAARAAVRVGAWASMSPAARESLLHRLADSIEQHVSTLATLETLDNGMPQWVARELDVLGAVGVMRYMAGWPTKIDGRTLPFHNPQVRPVLGLTLKEPIGVVAAIVPWNVPLMMAIWKLAPALATGCAVVLKPAEEASLSALFLGELVAEAGFPPGVVNIVTGLGPEAGEALTSHPDVDKIVFTGSTSTGVAVGRAAAANSTPVSLELGGKSPTIVFDDADIAAASAGAAESIFLNSGQICVAGSRLYVQSTVYDEVVERVAAHAAEHVIGNGLDPATTLGPLVSSAHQQRVTGYIDQASDDGATTISSHELPDTGFYVAPTIVTNADHAAAITQEEVFGPVLSVYSFEDEGEVLDAANNTPYGLAATVWTSSLARAGAIVDGLECGKISVNSPGFPYPGLPEGGKKASGFGRDLGPESLAAYLHTKAVILDGFLS